MNANAALAADTKSLDALRSQAKQEPDRALKDAAKQFEALFMQMLLKSMRDSLPKGGDPLASDATKVIDRQLHSDDKHRGKDQQRYTDIDC